ncbi:MAG: hypothetical protein ACLSTO_08790 [Bilophila wadsworthia]
MPRAEFPVILGRGKRAPLADGLALEVLAPAPGVTPSGNDGLVFRLVLNGYGLALLPGDAEAPYLRALLRSGADLSADVLVLPSPRFRRQPCPGSVRRGVSKAGHRQRRSVQPVPASLPESPRRIGMAGYSASHHR